jgi:predicted TIM-barrel fold metal-dependent hydrolase
LFPDDQSGNSPPFIGLSRDFNRPWDSEYPTELKVAGARAYNRWLAEFCSEAPERLLGIAMIGTLADVDAAIAEVRWAKENGINGGVLLPVFYYNTAEPFWNDRRYEPLWQACEELGVPLHTHVGPGTPNYGNGPEASMLYALESYWVVHRPLWFLILSGVLERHPDLTLIFTEQSSIWVIEALAAMDHFVEDPMFSSAAHEVITKKPSDYFHRQVWIGATLMSRPELEMRHAIGVKKLMWGSDFPHLESAWPHAREHLRDLMKGVPDDEVRAMTAGNAVNAYDLDVNALQSHVERIGPLTSQVITA